MIKKEAAAVVIGRNEGERLVRCLLSTKEQIEIIVYVDSGSTDGSVEFARSIGVDVLCLDMRIPFNAGRARNEGFHYVTSKYKELKYVQFIDGDCELCPEWVKAGTGFLEKNPEYAIVSGRVKERHPDASIYNGLCDIEWSGSGGDVRSCGGIFLILVQAFSEVNGFNAGMAAGEEPEMCFRIRQNGWKLFTLDELMVLHDAGIYHFYQWWKRSIRGGLAYAHGLYLHYKDTRPHHLRENARILSWAAGIPVLVLITFMILGVPGLLILCLYPWHFIKQLYRMKKKTGNSRLSTGYAFYSTIEKFPQFYGQLVFLKRLFFSQNNDIIEYK